MTSSTKIAQFLFIVTICSFCFSTLALAETSTGASPIPNTGSTQASPISTGNTGTFTLSNPLKVNSIGGLIQNFLEIFSYIVILIAVLALIYVGFLYVMSQGKPEKRKDLGNWLVNIVIGVAVVIAARLIVNVVINTLSATGTVDPGVIQSARNAAQGK